MSDESIGIDLGCWVTLNLSGNSFALLKAKINLPIFTLFSRYKVYIYNVNIKHTEWRSRRCHSVIWQETLRSYFLLRQFIRQQNIRKCECIVFTNRKVKTERILWSCSTHAIIMFKTNCTRLLMFSHPLFYFFFRERSKRLSANTWSANQENEMRYMRINFHEWCDESLTLEWHSIFVNIYDDEIEVSAANIVKAATWRILFRYRKENIFESFTRSMASGKKMTSSKIVSGNHS